MTRHLTPLTAPANLTMSSKEIAELTGKEHRNVLADIRSMLEALGLLSADFSAQYRDTTGRTLPMFSLPKDLTITLISGYSVVMRHRIVTRWQELEAQQQVPALPNFGNPAEAARAWALQFERAEQQAQKVIEVSQELARSEVIASNVVERNETLLGFVRHNLHGVSQTAIQKWLKAEGYLLRREGHWEPRATAKDLFEARYTKIHEHTHSIIYPTEKGKRLLVRLYCEGRLPMTSAAQKKRGAL